MHRHIPTWKGTMFLVVIAMIAAVFVDAAGILWYVPSNVPVISALPRWKTDVEIEPVDLPPIPKDLRPLDSPPSPPSIELMKTKGCIADGLLSGYGKEKDNVKLINRSECRYLHRAIETWLDPPDFEEAQQIKDMITRKDITYGMFIAEAIETKKNYDYPPEDREFEFNKMCRGSSKNYWGEHTCIPSLGKAEYRKYVQYITERAMDMGVQSFMFGQVYYQEPDVEHPVMPEVIARMREYAAFRGMKIVIGAQTNDITNADYLKLFDYVEGGVGLHEDGTVENGPCFSRWWSKPGDWCWALLWNDKFKSKANNVLVHFDWSGKLGDDMSTFARMDKDMRTRTLRNLHEYFLSHDVGFLLPVLAILPDNNGGCYGPKPKYYSPDNKYFCGDEDAINAILHQSTVAKK